MHLKIRWLNYMLFGSENGGYAFEVLELFYENVFL